MNQNEENVRSFEANMNRLNEIVYLLEKGRAPLAESLALFEEGTRLVACCTRQLDEADQKVTELQMQKDASAPPAQYAGQPYHAAAPADMPPAADDIDDLPF